MGSDLLERNVSLDSIVPPLAEIRSAKEPYKPGELKQFYANILHYWLHWAYQHAGKARYATETTWLGLGMMDPGSRQLNLFFDQELARYLNAEVNTAESALFEIVSRRLPGHELTFVESRTYTVDEKTITRELTTEAKVSAALEGKLQFLETQLRADRPYAQLYKLGAGSLFVAVLSLAFWGLTGIGAPFHPIFAVGVIPASLGLIAMAFLVRRKGSQLNGPSRS